MDGIGKAQRFQTVVIGGGQAGLSLGYHLARRGMPFVILDAGERVGDAWRSRWDSLQLFTPARYDGLDGMAFPAPPRTFPTKDAMADYLEGYATHFGLPVRSGVRVDGLSRLEDRFLIRAGDLAFEADNVVVAMGSHQRPKVPTLAQELDPRIVQLHSLDYRNPSQLREGDVLVVGAANSGADIAMDLVRSHRVWMAGPNPGQVPFPFGTRFTLAVGLPVMRFVGHRLLHVATPLGRKARPKLLHRATPLIRYKGKDLAAAGIERVPRVIGVRGGMPRLEDGRVLEVSNVIWCTGYLPTFSWIDLPVFDDDGQPRHRRGVVPDEPGLYFLGLHFLSSMTSETVTGVGRDASYIARSLAARVRASGATPAPGAARQEAAPIAAR